MADRIIALKNKVMFLVFVLLIGMFIFYISYSVNRSKSDFDQYLDRSYVQLISLFNHEVDHIVKFYFSRIDSIIATPGVLEAIKNKDTKTLRKLTAPVYKVMKNENENLQIMHFTDVNNITILRNHNPEKYGDDLTDIRPIVKFTNKNMIPGSGFESGKHGLFFRMIKPILVDGDHYGALEFGIKVDYFNDVLKRILPQAKFAFLIKKDYIKSYIYKDRLASLGDYYIYFETDNFFSSNFSSLDSMQKYYDINKNRYAIQTAYSFNNFEGKEYVKVLAAHDITKIFSDMKKSIYAAAVFGIFIIIIILFILNYAFNIYIKRFNIISEELSDLYEMFNKGETVIVKYKLSAKTIIEYVSGNVEMLTGYSQRDIQSRKVSSDVLFGLDKMSYAVDIKESASSDEFYVAEPYRIVTKNGEQKWIRNKVKLVREKSGEFLYLSFLNDISDLIHAQRGLEDQNNFVELLLDNIPIPIYYKDNNIIYQRCNNKFVEINGFTSKNDVIGKSFYDFAPPELAKIYYEKDMEIFNSEEGSQVYESRIKNRITGQIKDVVFYKRAFYGLDGTKKGIIGALVDVTEKNIVHDRLLSINKELENYYKIMNEHLISANIDKSGDIIFASEAFADISGYSVTELTGSKFREFIRTTDNTEFYINMMDMLLEGKEWKGELKNLTKNGDVYYVWSKASPNYNHDGDYVGFSIIFTDITDKKRIELLSITDKLTNVFNRMKLDEVLAQEIDRSLRYSTALSIIMADIDFFKKVNDEFGHQVGDEVLIKISALISEKIRKTDILGRWGGEEFLIVCPHTDLSGGVTLAETLRTEIENLEIDPVGRKTCSFGVAQFNSDNTEESLVKRADDALYKAKETRNKVES